MSAVCPNGHTSAAEDFCDTCGAKIDLANQPEAAAAPAPAAPGRRRPGEVGGGCGRARAAGMPELLGAQHPGRAVLRGVRLRLHDRRAAAGRGAQGGRGVRRTVRRPRRAPRRLDRAGHPAGVGGRGLGGPRLVRRPGGRGADAVARAARRGRPDHAQPAHRPGLAEPQHPPGHRLHVRHRGQPPARPADDRRTTLVRRGPRLVQRDLRGARLRDRCRRTRSPSARVPSSTTTTGSTSARGPASWSGRPPTTRRPPRPPERLRAARSAQTLGRCAHRPPCARAPTGCAQTLWSGSERQPRVAARWSRRQPEGKQPAVVTSPVHAPPRQV